MKAHIPVQVMKNNSKARMINPNLLLPPQDAVHQYRLNGGSITDPELSITDPLCDLASRRDIRLRSFNEKYSCENIFHGVVNGNKLVFIDSVKYFIDITYRLSNS